MENTFEKLGLRGELAEALAGQVAAGDKILIARAKVAREVLPVALRQLGAQVDVCTAYETVSDCDNKEELLAALAQKGTVVTFTSSSTVTNLLQVLGENKEMLKNAVLAAIGPVTAATLQKQGLNVGVEAAEFTIDGLVKAIEEYYKFKE